MMKKLAEILNSTGCSLVVEKDGETTTYDKKGVRDLIWLLDNEPSRLQGARTADKVVGKAAAGLMVQGGVREVYAEVISQQALPLFDEAGIPYTYGTLVDHIAAPEDGRCPLERIVAHATTAQEVETALRQHFEEMRLRQTS